MYIKMILFGAYHDAPFGWKVKHILQHYFYPSSIRRNLIEALVRKDLLVIANAKINMGPEQIGIYMNNKKKKGFIFNSYFERYDTVQQCMIED